MLFRTSAKNLRASGHSKKSRVNDVLLAPGIVAVISKEFSG